jgi:hypothetical protein
MNEDETINRGAKFGGEDRLLRKEEYEGKTSRRRGIGGRRRRKRRGRNRERENINGV